MAKIGEQVQLGGSSSARFIFTSLVLIIETLSVGTQARNTQFKWDKNVQHQRFKIGMMSSNLSGKFQTGVYPIANANFAKRFSGFYKTRCYYVYHFLAKETNGLGCKSVAVHV